MKSKTYSSKSNKGEMKRSNSKRGPTSNSSDLGLLFSNKYGHPSEIGLNGPGNIKISKEKVYSRGSARLNKSPGENNPTRSSRGRMVGYNEN